MKLAVAAIDESTISRHFGQTSCFLVYEIENDQIAGRELRQVQATHEHANGTDADEHRHAEHGHQALAQALADCRAVLCGGIGSRAADDLRAGGIEPLVLAQPELPPDEAVAQLMAGTLLAGQVHACCCGHHHDH